MKKIESIDRLFAEVRNGHTDFIVRLNGGLRSSKYITEGDEVGEDGGDTLEILNLVDDSVEVLDFKGIEAGIIGLAIRNGAFYMEED